MSAVKSHSLIADCWKPHSTDKHAVVTT